MTRKETPEPESLPSASVADTLGLIGNVVLPTIAKGVLIRRPRMVSLAERLGLDDRAVEWMQRLRSKYGAGPLMLALPGRRQAVILNPDDVRTVLEGAPEPFAPASSEKRAALAHFEPEVSLASHGPARQARRQLSEQALETARPVHALASAFLDIMAGEAEALLDEAGDEVDWDRFSVAWHRAVRSIVLGRRAREDHELTDMLARLRAAGNWAFMHPGRPRLRRRVHQRLAHYLERADSTSIAGRMSALPKTEDAAPTHQITQYLFAFDPGGMACFRTLALLAAHRSQLARARHEIESRPDDPRMPFLRACYLESLRLWPTTPAILRQTTRGTRWDNGTMPEKTSILIYAPYFHRDDRMLPHAHRFAPEIWLGKDAGPWPLVPFSGGPGLCPARHLVPMLGAGMLRALLRRNDFELKDPQRLQPDRPLPGLLDNYTLAFRRRRRRDADIAA